MMETHQSDINQPLYSQFQKDLFELISNMREEFRTGIVRIDTSIQAVKERVDKTNGSVGRHEAEISKTNERLALLERGQMEVTDGLEDTVKQIEDSTKRIHTLEVTKKTETDVSKLSNTKIVIFVSVAGLLMKLLDLIPFPHFAK